MALGADALVTLAEAKASLNVTGSSDDSLIETAIDAASVAIADFCRRFFTARTVTAARVEGPAGPRLWLTAVPLDPTASVTVTVDDVAQTVWRTEADGAPGTYDVIARDNHLYRRAWWRVSTATDPYNVLLTYTGGYAAAALPKPVKQACLYMVQKFVRDQKKQLAEIASVTTAAGTVQVLDTDIPRVAKALIEPYAIRRVAGC